MSFRINTNVTAMTALTNLNNNSDMLQTSITRLSTGLRINSGADDPAGLIISQQYAAQIGGLQQAIQNSQDGVNFAKTADGALGEVSNLLNQARTLAVASANSGTLSGAQLAADQSQLTSIVSSINRIASNTQFGNKFLLNGSAGTSSTITDATRVSSLNIGGTFSGAALTASNSVAVNVTTAATQASINSATFSFATSTVAAAGSFSINGVTFNASAADTAATLVDSINKAQGQTGVVAVYDATNTHITLSTSAYGSSQTINLTDSNGVIRNGGAGFTTASGTDALATTTIGTATALFTGSKNGTDGLTLTDADGNTLRLTSAGNATGSHTVGQVTVGSSQFQIGANANQTASLSLSNMSASQLGTGVASGVNLSNLDLTTTAGANQAIQVIDAAINQVTSARGQIGSFQNYVLQSNIRSLGVAQTNLSAAKSTITDTDVAAEMTAFTKEQILQQSGMSVLAQANALPQSVLKLLG
jgi:flagellin